MREIKIILAASALLAVLAMAPKAHAQIIVNIGVQPVCSYGYYDYAPYECAPMGFYGQGYFHNGIFLGMGPWAGWGYGHGWGGYRFRNDGGGRYHGRGGFEAARGYARGGREIRGDGYRDRPQYSRGRDSHRGPSRDNDGQHRGDGGGHRDGGGGHGNDQHHDGGEHHDRGHQ